MDRGFLLKKAFELPEGVQAFRVIVNVSRPLKDKDFIFRIANVDAGSRSMEDSETNLSWSPALKTRFHYCGSHTNTGWVELRLFTWDSAFRELAVEVTNWHAKDVDSVIHDFRLGAVLSAESGERVTIIGREL